MMQQTKTIRSRRRPVEALIGKDVLTEIRSAATALAAAEDRAHITTAEAAQLAERYEVEERYGLTKRRLFNYLKRVAGSSMASTETEGSPKSESSDDWERRQTDHRLRQMSVATILDRTLGTATRCDPDLWERKAYLLLIGIVYERLATNEHEIPTDELVKLAKALAENRRAEARRCGASTGRDATDPPPTDQPMPSDVADMVRHLYGVELEDKNSPVSDRASE